MTMTADERDAIARDVIAEAVRALTAKRKDGTLSESGLLYMVLGYIGCDTDGEIFKAFSSLPKARF